MKVHFERVLRSTSLAISLVRLLRKYYSHLHLKEWLLMKLKCNLLSFHLLPFASLAPNSLFHFSTLFNYPFSAYE